MLLEPQLEPISILLALLLVRIGEAAIRGRQDLYRLSRQLSWGHGGLTCVLLITRTCPTKPVDLLWILMRSILASQICRGTWAISLPVFDKLWSECIERPLNAIRSAKAAKRWRIREQQRLEEQQRRIERDRIDAEKRRQEQREDAIRQAERDAALWRQKQEANAEAAARFEIARKEREANRLRREDARLRCELVYQQFARQLGVSFSRKRLDQFLDRYLSDSVSAEDVEQRERMLKQMMLDSLGTSVPTKFTSMSELAAYYQARREEINRLPHDEEIKDTYHVQLNKQEDEALRRMLKP